MRRFNFRTLVYSLALLFLWTQCITTGEPFSGLPPGIWRGVLYLDEGTQKSPVEGAFDEASGAELPFNFEVVYDTQDSFHIVIHNAEERIIIDDIAFGLDRSTGKDTVLIPLSAGNSFIKALYEEDAIEGDWILPAEEDYRVPFRAIHSKNYRFTELKKAPVMDISGEWEVRFSIEEETPESAVGIFELEGNHLSATFATGRKEYRNLEGTVQANRLFLSAFDGARALLFEAKILEDGSMSGIFRNGSHQKSYWSATRKTDGSGMNQQ